MNKPRSLKSKILKIAAIIFAALIIVICIMIVILQTHRPQDLKIMDVDIGAIKDGVYTDSAENGIVNVTVSVEVYNGSIVDVTILEHDNLLGKPAEAIVESIIEQQSLDVDAITSATYSSDTIRKAIENALRQGE